MAATRTKKPISDRISLFEQKTSSSSPVGTPGSPREKLPASRTLSGKNFSALKSQFDSSPPPPPTSSPPPSCSPPPPPPPRSLPPDSPPEVPRRSGNPAPIASKRSSGSPRKCDSPTPKNSSPSKAKKATSACRSPPSGQQKKKVTSSSSTVPVKKSSPPAAASKVSKVMASKTMTSPLTPPIGAGGGQMNSVTINVTSEAANGSLKKQEIASRVVPKVTVTLEDVEAKHTSLFSETDDNVCDEDLKNIKNKKAAAAEVAGVGGHWAKQALQNDNSAKINQAMKLDLEDKINNHNNNNRHNIDEINPGAFEDNNSDVNALKRQKTNLEMRLKDQEEELDDLAGQVQLLEQSKAKLEASMTALKKEHRRELGNKEEELEDARTAAQKKVKALEQQLENEHEERLNFLREKQTLESRIMNLQVMTSRSADEDHVVKLRKDLKRTKALLKDAQLTMERSSKEASNKVVLRQLKNQLEDAEFARTAALKARANLELELSDVQQQLDDVSRNKSDTEDRLLRMSRERADLSTQLDDNEEELQEVMKKFKASVSQLSVDQITIQEQTIRISDLEEERNRLREQIAEMNVRIESLDGENMCHAQHNRLELKIKELESKLELEQTTRSRMETQIVRLKEAIERLNHECDSLRMKEASALDHSRKLQRQLRDVKENYATLQQKETDVNAKKNEYEKLLELAEAETVTSKNDLKAALKRIEDLQTAINGELDSESDYLNSDGESDDDSEDGMDSFYRRPRSKLETMPEEPELKMSGGSTSPDLMRREEENNSSIESQA